MGLPEELAAPVADVGAVLSGAAEHAASPVIARTASSVRIRTGCTRMNPSLVAAILRVLPDIQAGPPVCPAPSAVAAISTIMELCSWLTCSRVSPRRSIMVPGTARAC